jgi:large repetitive protein
VVHGSLRVVSAGRFVPDAEVTVHEGGVAIDTTLGNVASIAIDDGTLAFRGDRTFDEQGTITGSGALVVSGSGTTVQLLQDNTYTGGTRIDAGVLELSWRDSAGTGPITFLSGSTGTLRLEQTIVSNAISGFLPGTTIDLGGFGLGTSASLGAGNVLTVSGGSYGPGGQFRLNLDPAQSYTGYAFRLSADGRGGTDLTVVPASATGT